MKNKGLNINELKIIAIIAMTIDHITTILLSDKLNLQTYIVLRAIGRITIPIMWFSIVEGYYHTKNIKKYIGRLFIFSIISHFAYTYAFEKPIIPKSIFFETIVIWSLMWGLIALWIAKTDKLKKWMKIILILAICTLTYKADWGIVSVLAIVGMGIYRENFTKQMLALCIPVVLVEIIKYGLTNSIWHIIQLSVFFSIPLLAKYNGEKGEGSKWFFYIYYPIHLILLGIISNFI